jgi:hypothetical protein
MLTAAWALGERAGMLWAGRSPERALAGAGTSTGGLTAHRLRTVRQAAKQGGHGRAVPARAAAGAGPAATHARRPSWRWRLGPVLP